MFSVLDVLAPHLVVSHTAETRGRPAVRPTVPRHRTFAPVRPAARCAAELLRASLHERRTLDRIAEAVHLSPSQAGRVFTEAFGKTRFAYLTMLRTEQMTDLLRTTDTPIVLIARRVGWGVADFRCPSVPPQRGLTPSRYQAMSRNDQAIR